MNLKERFNNFLEETGLKIPEIAEIIKISKENLYKWRNGTVPHNSVDYQKLNDFMDRFEFGDQKPAFRLVKPLFAYSIMSLFGHSPSGIIEVYDEGMQPTFRIGSRLIVSELTNISLIVWGDYYVLIDKNQKSLVRKVFQGENKNLIKLVSDQPDANNFPDIIRQWDEIEKVYRINAVIAKY